MRHRNLSIAQSFRRAEQRETGDVDGQGEKESEQNRASRGRVPTTHTHVRNNAAFLFNTRPPTPPNEHGKFKREKSFTAAYSRIVAFITHYNEKLCTDIDSDSEDDDE